MSADQINAFLIFIGSLMIFKSCFLVYRDKGVRGVSILANLYFTAWGNLERVLFSPSTSILVLRG